MVRPQAGCGDSRALGYVDPPLILSCSQSISFINLNDVDGTLSAGTVAPGLPPSSAGQPNTAVLGPNAMAALPSPACYAVPAWNGFICPGVLQRSFALLSLGACRRRALGRRMYVLRNFLFLPSSDSLAGRENYGGLEITRIQDPSWSGIRISDNSTWRTSIAFGTTYDPCPFVFPGGMYAGTITAGSVTQLFWPATQPSQFRFNVNMPDPAEGAVMRLFVQVRNHKECVAGT